MTSAFDSDVRARREHTPWTSIKAWQFMKEMSLNAPDGKDRWEHNASLSVHYRPDVASRFWWTITWTSEDGIRKSADSQELDLCLWRAATMEMYTHERLERERKQKDAAP